MARPIEHDRDEVVTNAMKAFWLKGYEATSISDLVEATGLTTRSMYNIFGSKNGLFKAALERYYQLTVGDLYSELRAGQGRSAIRNFVIAVMSGKPLNGCLFANTFSEKNSVERDALKRVQKYFRNLEAQFKEKLEYAQQHENFKSDPELRAKQLITIIQGMALFSKSGVAVKDQTNMAEDFLDRLEI